MFKLSGLHLQAFTVLVFLMLNFLTCQISGQEKTGTNKELHVSGSAGATNNGISLIPNFSLGQPAALFNLSVSKGRFSFDTDFNFSLKAKPWYSLYWLRYKVVDNERLKINASTHLGLNFVTKEVQIGMKPTKMPMAERYWVGEFVPGYVINRNASVGMCYMLSVGLDPGTFDASHFIALNANLTCFNLPSDFYLRVTPQLYFLKQDELKGSYATSTFTLSNNNFPFSLSALVNHEIKTEITEGKGWLWNITATFHFGR